MNPSLHRRISAAPRHAFALILVLTIDWSDSATAVTIVDSGDEPEGGFVGLDQFGKICAALSLPPGRPLHAGLANSL